MLLLRAGDVEQNPGPTCKACNIAIAAGKPYLSCFSCDARSHKGEKCSGLSRTRQALGIWKCKSCAQDETQAASTLNPPSPSPPPASSPDCTLRRGNQVTLVGQVVGAPRQVSSSAASSHRCTHCDRVVRATRFPIKCGGCDMLCHKSCTGLVRSRQLVFIDSNAWRCEGCSKKSNSAATDPALRLLDASVKRSDFGSRNSIRMLQWNANGLKTKMVELADAVKKLKIDILLIQESKLRPNDKSPSLPGYSEVRKDRGTDKGGGLVTFVKDDIPFITVDHSSAAPGSLLESLTVKLKTSPNSHLSFTNVYCPPTRGDRRGHEFETTELPYGKDDLIGGDLNTHSNMWDQWQPEDRMGLEVEAWLLEKDFMVANDGSATRVNAGTGGSSAPDVTLFHSSLSERTEWSVSECLGSDHLPIILSIDCQVSTLSPPPITQLRWNWKKANFDGFRVCIESSIHTNLEMVENMTLNKKMHFLNDSIIKAATEHIGTVKITKNCKEWMSREIREAVKDRNRLRRQVSTRRTDWIEACRVVQALIKESKEKKWFDFLSDVSSSSDPNKIWETIRSLSGRNANSLKNESLIDGDKCYVTSRAKANAFMKRYAEISRLDINKEDRLKKTIRHTLNAPRADEQCCQPFSTVELSQAIESMKTKGAPGKDQIAPRFLKALGPNAIDLLLNIINESWSTGISPFSWREAIIVPLLKKGKPASDIDSFRPVSLTSCVAKTMERMVANRITYLAEVNGWWSKDQAGFRSQRSCEDQVLRLTQSISNALQSTPPSRSILALLDFSKAYDKVWKNRLFQIMLNKGVPRAMVNWCRGFLSDRRAMVRIDGVLGKSFKLHQGVPQGAVLSPILFLFFIDGISDVIPEDAQISLYADDIAVWGQNKDKARAQEVVQEAVSRIANWSKSHKLVLNPSKCESTLFSTCPSEANWTPLIRIEENVLKVNPTPTFLGVTLDRTLTFRQHVTRIKSRVMNRIRILSTLASKEWGCSRPSLYRIYQATIHSVFHYCGPAWQPWLAKSNRTILERVQNRALRVLTGQLADTPLECLRLEAGISSFETAIRRNCAVAWEKSARVPWSNPRRQLFEAPVFHRWKRKSWSESAKRECDDLGISDFERKPFPGPGSPPWLCLNNSRVSIHTGLANNSKKNSSHVTLLEDAISSISMHGPTKFTIYTDGAADAGIKNGGSAAIITTGGPSNPTLIKTLSCKGSRWTSSYETEVTALLLAANWIKQEGTEEDHILICSDSQSALSALEGSGKEDDSDIATVRKRLASVKPRISMQWIPGHCGIIGNEWADKAAGVAATTVTSLPPLSPDTQTPLISYAAVKALIIREIKDPPTSHQRTKEVYGDRSGITNKNKKIYKNHGIPDDNQTLSRSDAVLIAQLRSGHCHKLAAYRNVVDQNSSPYCPYCKDEFETLEHWLRECPATARKRIRGFGGAAPPLSVLVDDPKMVLAFSHGLTSM